MPFAQESYAGEKDTAPAGSCVGASSSATTDGSPSASF